MPANSKPPIHRDPFAPGDDPRRQRGRKTGSRAKLGKRFFEDIYAAWEEQGESVLARAAFHDPMGFASMVARLMPQKLEISTPTDGMSDERLAELLDYAERMAALRNNAATPGPLIEHDPMSGNKDYRTQPVADLGHASLVPPAHAADHENGSAADRLEGRAGEPPARSGAGGVTIDHTLRAAAAKSAEPEYNTLDHSTDATPDSQNATVAKLPYPVGRPFPKPDHDVERANQRALDDIDPESLF